MMSFKSLPLLLPILLLTTAATKGEQQLLTSPCPEVFRFDSQEDGAWNATLLLNSPHVLKGIFIKIYFDQDVDELSVQEDFGGDVMNLDDPANRAFLIKNKDEILADRISKKIQILVSYSGSAPNIKEFRVNGYTLCPNINSDRIDFYPGDPQAALSNYLESITYETGLFSSKECGKYEGSTGFPWQAALFTTNGKTNNYTCEATLISPKYLVTSAHCVSYLNTRMPLLAEKLEVYFSMENINQIEKRQPFTISKVILYPGYQPQNLLNDIALIQLRNPTEIKVMPACLPTENFDEKAKETLVGYKLENNKFTTIGSTELNIIEQENCFKTDALKAFLGDNTYCASYADEKSLTFGDSGSGSFARFKDQYQLRGLFTIGGALLKDNSRNILLTDVYKYDKWIRKHLAL